MNKLSSVMVAMMIAACGGGGPKQAATPLPPAAPAAAAPATAGGVELGELKFYAGDDLGMQLHANGHLEVKVAKSDKPTEISWQDVGSIAADGTISSSDGKKQGQVNADGSFAGPDGQTAPFHLEGETLVVADKKITIDDKGMLQGGNAMEKPMRIEGATTPGLRRTALVLLAIVLSGPDQGAAPPPAQGGGGGGY